MAANCCHNNDVGSSHMDYGSDSLCNNYTWSSYTENGSNTCSSSTIPTAALSLVHSQPSVKKGEHGKGHPPLALVTALPALTVQLVTPIQSPVLHVMPQSTYAWGISQSSLMNHPTLPSLLGISLVIVHQFSLLDVAASVPSSLKKKEKKRREKKKSIDTTSEEKDEEPKEKGETASVPPSSIHDAADKNKEKRDSVNP